MGSKEKFGGEQSNVFRHKMHEILVKMTFNLNYLGRKVKFLGPHWLRTWVQVRCLNLPTKRFMCNVRPSMKICATVPGSRPGLPNPWPAKLGPQGLFERLISSWKGLLSIFWQIKRSKPKPSSVWFSRNQFGFAAKTFFLVFTYFWGQILEILTEISTD